MTLEQLNKNVQAFDVEKELDSIIKSVEHIIIDANTAQLYSGILSTGENITPDYTPKTVKLKKEKGQPYDRVTLKDSGDFYSGFKLEKMNNDWELDSTDYKTDKLATKYTEDIFGVTKENMAEITDEQLTPKLTERLQAIL